jgi:molybdopterin synthase sulfur carrier subunit
LSVRVRLPPLLRTLSGGAREMTADGGTIESVMANLAEKHPAFARHLFDEAGFLRPSIVFLHGGGLVRSGEAAAHSVRDGDEIVLTNALSGG